MMKYGVEIKLIFLFHSSREQSTVDYPQQTSDQLFPANHSHDINKNILGGFQIEER